jgi:hypothetical protein
MRSSSKRSYIRQRRMPLPTAQGAFTASAALGMSKEQILPCSGRIACETYSNDAAYWHRTPGLPPYTWRSR